MDCRYGEIFKLLRNQRKLPLSYFEQIGIGKSNVGKFERGEIMMSFERVNNMLELMNVSLGEYEIIVNRCVPDFLNSFLIELATAEFYQNSERLIKLYEESKETENMWLVLIAKSRIKGLTSQEIVQVKAFLADIKEWGYFEVTLAFSVVDFFEKNDIVQLIGYLKIKGRKNYGEYKYRRRLFQLVYRSVILLAAKGSEKEAKKGLALAADFGTGSPDFYISTLNLLATGVVEYLYRDKKEGKGTINDSLFMIEKLGCSEFKAYHEKRILKILGIKQL
jgi:Rgg/GadR/MutR family transcriptional activator